LKKAFSLIELIFVIVVMGIVGKFGAEFLAQAYNNFIYTTINNTLQAKSEMALNIIASRLQYRIKDSTIARKNDNFLDFKALSSVEANETYDILEWIGSDIDGFRGLDKPYWSGIIDLNHPNTNSTHLVSPMTNTIAINDLIQVLSYKNSDINDSALYFIGSNNNIKTGYGWDKNTTHIDTQHGAMHPIRADNNISVFIPTNSKNEDNNLSTIDVYEYYKLSWSAYGVGISDYNDTTHSGTLILYYDYQPWLGESYKDAQSSIIMENVSTFRFLSNATVIKIQICVKTNIVEDYSLCKEKTVF
jgi:prepilin-type N-terminal cleavage/methylation domain-containing protein